MFNKNQTNMKSIKIFAVAGVIGLLGMAGLSSCKQNNTPDEGNYNGEVVKTQFTISIPQAGQASTGAPDRMNMPANTTQTDANPTSHFLGMDNITLIPFNVATPAHDLDLSAGKRWGSSNIGGLGNITSLEGASTDKYKVYSNVSIPLGTNQFLFYAHGIGSNATAQDKFEYGSLTPTGLAAGSPAGIHFDLEQIYSGDSKEGVALARYLTSIANAKDNKETPADASDDVYWGAHSNNGIKKLHDAFITMHAGASKSVLAAVEDLYNTLDQYNENWKANNDGANDAVVKAVLDSIDAKVTITGSTVGSKTLAWDPSAEGYDALRNYPSNINLPDGSAYIWWNETPNPDTFAVYNSYAAWTAANGATPGNTVNFTKATKYVYPACVYYYVNSGLKTSDAKQSPNYGTNTWTTILGLYTGPNAVSSDTRSVAIQEKIQYAVASLKTKVKANAANIPDNKDAAIPVENLEMTAVLVGGQGQVGYNFAPADGSGDLIIYDSVMTTGSFSLNNNASSYTDENPTLVLQTNPSTKILMAVEFLNKGVDFYGQGSNTIIPHGTKFYVVAELDATGLNASNPQLVDAMGHRVFMQDYTTTVKLNLKDLKHAYNVVPDLRSTNLELGFSVDLSWQSGHEFDITLGDPDPEP